MSNILDLTQALLDRADRWETLAKGLREFDPENQVGVTLEKCAAQLRGDAEDAAPAWVPLTTVVTWSRWSAGTLRRRCREQWEPRGLARLDDSGRWEVERATALAVPARGVQTEDLEGIDLDAMARKLAS